MLISKVFFSFLREKKRKTQLENQNQDMKKGRQAIIIIIINKTKERKGQSLMQRKDQIRKVSEWKKDLVFIAPNLSNRRQSHEMKKKRNPQSSHHIQLIKEKRTSLYVRYDVHTRDQNAGILLVIIIFFLTLL